MRRFEDRTEAGWRLAEALQAYNRKRDTVVMALPRGGVPIGYEVAEALSLPLDIWLVRKLGAPGQGELAIGAIAMGGISYLNEDIVRSLGVRQQQVDDIIEKETRELRRRNEIYRSNRSPTPVKGKIVIIVDDGLATGATMHVAVESLRKAGAARIVVAVPVGPADTCDELKKIADEVVCLYKPAPFYGVGQWYKNFTQLEDGIVREYIERHILHNLGVQVQGGLSSLS